MPKFKVHGFHTLYLWCRASNGTNYSTPIVQLYASTNTYLFLSLSPCAGCPQFSKLNVLDDSSYVKDDVLYLKCIIDTSRIFHP